VAKGARYLGGTLARALHETLAEGLDVDAVAVDGASAIWLPRVMTIPSSSSSSPRALRSIVARAVRSET
jgi:hypothetical protein